MNSICLHSFHLFFVAVPVMYNCICFCVWFQSSNNSFNKKLSCAFLPRHENVTKVSFQINYGQLLMGYTVSAHFYTMGCFLWFWSIFYNLKPKHFPLGHTLWRSLMFIPSFFHVADENPDEVYFQELPVWKREYFWYSFLHGLWFLV